MMIILSVRWTHYYWTTPTFILINKRCCNLEELTHSTTGLLKNEKKWILGNIQTHISETFTCTLNLFFFSWTSLKTQPEAESAEAPRTLADNGGKTSFRPQCLNLFVLFALKNAEYEPLYGVNWRGIRVQGSMKCKHLWRTYEGGRVCSWWYQRSCLQLSPQYTK